MAITTSNIKRKNLQELAKYQRTLWKFPQLTYLFLEVTDCCNLKCKHCGSGCLSTNKNYLSFESVKKVLDEVTKEFDASQILICITGGEPLLNKDLYKIIAYSKHLGFSCGMTTNGTLLSEFVGKQLKDAGLDTISISLDGLESTHNNFRCNTNAFQLALKGIKNAQSVGLYPEVVTVVHKNNLKELDILYEFLCEEKIGSWKIANIDPIGRAKENSSMLLDAQEYKMLLDFVKRIRFNPKNNMEVNLGCSHYLGLQYEHIVRDFYFQCEAGTKVASIMANGDIGACLDIERNGFTIQGNIHNDSFVDVWKNRFKIFRQDKAELNSQCKECSEKDFCMGDSTHTWNFFDNEPNYCVFKMLEDHYVREK